MADTPFQLGVSRTVPHASSISVDTKHAPCNNASGGGGGGGSNNVTAAAIEAREHEVLRPTEDAISWSGSSSSSDMLF